MILLAVVGMDDAFSILIKGRRALPKPGPYVDCYLSVNDCQRLRSRAPWWTCADYSGTAPRKDQIPPPVPACMLRGATPGITLQPLDIKRLILFSL